MKTTLKVKEMACEHCVQRITETLKGLGLDPMVSLAEKTVVLEAEDAEIEKAILALDDIGFTAER